MAFHVELARQAQRKKQSRFMELVRNTWENKLLLALALPGVILIFMVSYVPMFGIIIAFQDFRAESGFLSPWVGLKNFELLFSSPVVVRLVRNTIVLNTLFIAFEMIFAVGMALVINELGSRFFRRLYQSVMFLPFFMSWAVVSMLIFGWFDYEVGLINVALKGVGAERIAFFDNPDIWPGILTMLRVWKGTGSGCILYLAVLIGIDPQLYEAASIDGAGRLARMRHISVPTLVPTMILLALLSIGRIFYGDFGMIYAIIGSSAVLWPTTDVIDTYIIRALQSTANFGMSTAVGLSQSVLGFICVFGSNWIARKWSQRRGEDYALF
jgi:putative aldouronate transport system permease protein